MEEPKRSEDDQDPAPLKHVDAERVGSQAADGDERAGGADQPSPAPPDKED